MTEWAQHVFITLASWLGLLVVLAFWAIIIFIVVDEILDLIIRSRRSNNDVTD